MIEILHNVNGQDYHVLSGKVGSGASALLLNPGDTPMPFIVVGKLGINEWDHGSYFDNLNDAIDCLRESCGLEPVRW